MPNPFTAGESEREHQLQIALEAARLGSWTLDLASGLLECSPRCCENFGIAAGEPFDYTKLRALIHPEDRAAMQEAVDRALLERTDYEAEYRIIRSNGEQAWIVASGRALYDEQGKPGRMVGVTLDITKRKEQESAKQKSDETLSFAYAGGGVIGAWDWDVLGDRVYANARFAQLFSLDPEKVADGAPISGFIHAIHPEDRDRVGDAIARALETGAEFAQEYRVVQMDGSVRWIYAVGRCHKDLNGQPVRFPGLVFDTTERNLDGQRIQESQGRLKAIFDGTFEFIGLLTADGIVVEANRASLETVSIAREDVIGKPLWEGTWFALTEGAPAIVQEWVSRASRGEFVRQELQLNHPSGHILAFDISLYPVRDRSGKIVFIVPQGRDITGVKAAESRSAFLVNLDDCTRPLNDAQEIIQTATRLLREHLRADLCEYHEIVHGEAAQFGENAAGLLGANLPFVESSAERSLCATPLHKDGRLVAALAVIQKGSRQWRPEEVELVHMVGSRCWESLERARITRELRQQRHHFDAILSNSPDFTYTFDLRGRYTYANRALLSLLRLSLDDILGKTFFDLNFPEPLALQLQEDVRRVIDSKEVVRGQTPFSGPTGETRQYEYIFAPILDSEGEVEAVAGTTRDITERKQAEEQEREREEQLRESARLESLGVMAGGIAHDFNNLLTGILGNACMLADHIPDADGSIARQIVMAAERAADLTRQMLAFSGKGRFVVERIDLNAMVRENLALVRASLSRTASVQLDLSDRRCVVEGDGSQIQQVVMNLLINASEALCDRPGTVKIRTAITERVVKLFSPFLQTAVPAGRYVLLEVGDNGCGMTPETLKKIFDPFFTTKFTGRGLGLAAVLGIAKGHQGDIEVVTKPGSGTTFRVLFPLAEEEVKLAAVAVEGKGAATASGTILVVDDEEIVRKIAATALSRRGFHVLTATHGQEALDMLRGNPDIALVLLDLTMPVMTGEQAIPLMREIHPGIPIILSSGFNEAEVAHRFATAGISGFLQKPYTVSAIVSKVTELLKKLA